MKALILAGGLGTRMGDSCRDIPKSMVNICGKPVLQHQIETLSENGVKDFLIITFHLHSVIEDYFGNGERFGVNIEYFVEEKPMGTAGALSVVMPEEDFLLLNGDLVFDFNVEKMLSFHKSKNSLITVFAHPNNHPYDSSVIVKDSECRISQIISKNNKPSVYPNLCNAGVQIVSPCVAQYTDLPSKGDFDKDVIIPVINSGRVYAYLSAEYVHDMGTPQRLKMVEYDLQNGKIHFYGKKRKAIFVDRDGTLNEYREYITSPDQIKLIEGVTTAINRFHSLGYLVIVITNQPVVAHGKCTLSELENIHNYLSVLLGEQGAFVDSVYFCPHHPHKGYEGEVAELKKVCSCRKPAPGMIFKAAEEFNIDLGQSYMVGDSMLDVGAAKNAGCRPVLLSESGEKPECCESYKNLYDFSLSLK